MTFLIGGLSSQQYKAYLLKSVSEPKENENDRHWVAHFNLAGYPALAVVVNRLAYFTLHRFSIYPNNTYLFEKFKKHDFQAIFSQEQYEIVCQIFEDFKRCKELDPKELTKVENKLQSVKQRLQHKEKTEDSAEIIDDSKTDSPKLVKKEDLVVEIKGISKEKVVEPQEPKKIEVQQPLSNDPKQELSQGQSSTKQEEEVIDIDLEDSPLDSASKQESEKVDPPKNQEVVVIKDAVLTIKDQPKSEQDKQAELPERPKDTKQELNQDPSSAKQQEGNGFVDTKEPEKVERSKQPESVFKDKVATEPKTGDVKVVEEAEAIQNGSEDLTLDEEEEDLSQPGKNEQEKAAVAPPLLKVETETAKRLRALLEKFSQSQKEETEKVEDKRKKGVSVSLPKKVKDIISKPFPLDDSKSIHDLFLGSESALLDYRRSLKILLHFEKQLHAVKGRAEDSRFNDYLEKAQDAFDRAWIVAYGQCADLHKEFQKTFPFLAPELRDNGEIICTAEQLDWLSATMRKCFPAIYNLAFDAPSLLIAQSHQVATLAQSICMGLGQEKEVSSSCFIRLRTTLDQKTLVFERGVEDSPLLRGGSYILTHFVGAKGAVKQDPESLKKQINQLTDAYVQEWLVRAGGTLQFSDKAKTTIQGGQATATLKASDWVACVRNFYTQTLLAMEEKELKEVIRSSLDCPLMGLMIKLYKNEIDAEEWTASQFPAALMEKIFEEKLKKLGEKHPLYQAIRQTIDDASFSDEKEMKKLAEKAQCSLDVIEPLIRMRVFYMMGCLGLKASKAAVKGIDQRVQTMYDPAVCQDFRDPALHCQHNEERVITFDQKMDQMTVVVKTTFKTPHKVPAVAEGESLLHISSLNQSDKETKANLTDLQDLRFSLYSSQAQRRYLVAQLVPETLIAHVKKLATEIAKVELVKKAENYQKAQEAEAKKWWWKRQAINKSLYCSSEAELKAVIHQVEKWVTYLNTYQMLVYSLQLSPEQMKNFKQAQEEIRRYFQQMDTLLKEVHGEGVAPQVPKSAILEQIQQLRDLIEIQPKNLDVALIKEDEESDQQDVDEEMENERGIDSISPFGHPDEIIENLPGLNLFNQAMGFVVGESNRVKSLKWRIEQYEDLIEGVQKKFLTYFETKKLGTLQQILDQAKQKDAPQWLAPLVPLLQLCQKPPQIDPKRFDDNYLKILQKSYTEDFLHPLRQALLWAKEHPTLPGVEHLDTLCYQIYTTLNLDHLSQKGFKNLIESLKKSAIMSDVVLDQPLYHLLRDLSHTYQHVQAVADKTKVDLRLPLNPMHVLFNRALFGKGKNVPLNFNQPIKEIIMGSPLHQTPKGQLEIAPEFLATLRHYKRNGLSHVYLNRLNFIPKPRIEGDESTRCQALHDLAAKEFKGTLFVMTLNEHSPFYEQKGHSFTSLDVQSVKDTMLSQLLEGKSREMRHYLPTHFISQPTFLRWMTDEIDRIHQEEFKNCETFANENSREEFAQKFHVCLRNHVVQLLQQPEFKGKSGLGYSISDQVAARFKQEFLAQLFDHTPHETGNCIPAELEQRFNLRQWSQQAIDLIHQKIFEGRKQLTVDERRCLMRLFYKNLSFKVLIETKAHSSNLGCQDRKANVALMAEDVAYLAIVNNQMDDQTFKELFNMLVSTQDLRKEQFDHLLETLKFMLDNRRSLLELHGELFQEMGMTLDLASFMKK